MPSIGLDAEQIASFAFDRTANLWTGVVRAAMQSASRTRAQITMSQQSLVAIAHDQKKTYLTMANEEVWDEAKRGDVLLAAMWAGGKEAKARLERMGDFMRVWYPNPDHAPLPEEAQQLVDALPMRPFHWELEYPEVFVRKNPGFDCVVGNPPFGGKNTIAAADGAQFIPMLQAVWPHADGNSDLCAYFFLRARTSCARAAPSGSWPPTPSARGTRGTPGSSTSWTKAVDVVHGIKGKWAAEIRLGGEVVSGIASALTAGEELVDPVALGENGGKAFIGSYVLGMGFTLTPDEAAALIDRDPRNAEVIQPYMGGRSSTRTRGLSIGGTSSTSGTGRWRRRRSGRRSSGSYARR